MRIDPILKILLVKTSSMGDLVHALPVVSDIMRAYPDASIDWLAERPFDAIARLHPAVNKVIPVAWRKWRKSFWRTETRALMIHFWQDLRSETYDVVIDLQGLFKSAAMTRMVRLNPKPTLLNEAVNRGYNGYDKRSIREPLAAMAYHNRFEVSRQATSVMRNRQLAAAALGYELDDATDFGLSSFVSPSDWSFLSKHNTVLQTPWVALIHGASRDSKLWAFENWVQLIKQLAEKGQRCLLLWGSDAERVRSEQLYDSAVSAGVPATLLPIVPPFLSIAQVAQCLAASTAVVGLDSGFTHLAAALAKPTVGIYTDFNPQLAALTGVNYCVGLGGVQQAPSFETVSQQLNWAQTFDLEHRHRWLNGELTAIAESPLSHANAVLHHIRF